MDRSLLEDAYATLLPAFATTTLSDNVKKHLDCGGVSILIGETREEYVARSMTDQRRSEETAETIRTVTSEAKARSGVLLAAVDQEPGGICRLHDLVPQIPDAPHIAMADPAEIELIAGDVAREAASMGVNCFLAPILDLLTGRNPWLKGRTFSTDPAIVGRISAAFVRGVQQQGVAATAKHFPGFHDIARDPAVDPAAAVVAAADTFEPGFGPFRETIGAGVELIMVGPAIVRAFDPGRAALRSAKVVNILKKRMGFDGVVMADDLDSAATLRGDSIEQAAIDAVAAGCGLLLLADIDDQIDRVARALAEAEIAGEIPGGHLAASARKVRTVATKYDAS